jgi:hypothetical protein
MSTSNSTTWRKSCERWRSTSIIWSIVCLFQMIETIRNRVKIINRIWFRVIFLQINRSCSTWDHSWCFFRICFFKTCCFRICFSRFWAMKSRVRLWLNVFIVIRKIIYTKKNALSSMKILKRKEFICKKEKFISIFIILKFFTFKWFFYKSQR